MSEQALERGIDPSPWRWLETATITVVPIVLSVLFRPEDPLFVESEFPWMALAPLLAGLRYGFAHGFSSALVLTLAMGFRARALGPEAPFPGSRMVGILMLGMLAGEFSDRWLRRIQRLRVIGRYRQQRLEEFSRAYHLLKVSHDRLEERMAGNTTSLRGALLSLRRRLASASSDELSDVGGAIMDLLAEHAWVQVAGLHALDAQGQVVATPTASLGSPVRIDPQVAMIHEAVQKRALVTVKELPESSGALAVVPLESIEQELLGVVVIHEMPFVAFTLEHLHLLVVLGGHTADILVSARQALAGADPVAQDFLRALQRGHSDRKRFDLASSMVAVRVSPEGVEAGVDQVIEGTKRGLDIDWKRTCDDGSIVLLLFMPLTDGQGVGGYRQRVKSLVRERFGESLAEDGLDIFGQALSGSYAPEEQLEALAREAGVIQ